MRCTTVVTEYSSASYLRYVDTSLILEIYRIDISIYKYCDWRCSKGCKYPHYSVNN
jgi:hypothetical protein